MSVVWFLHSLSTVGMIYYWGFMPACVDHRLGSTLTLGLV